MQREWWKASSEVSSLWWPRFSASRTRRQRLRLRRSRTRLQQACAMGAPDPNCPAALRALKLMVQMNVATHLSTFPVS